MWEYTDTIGWYVVVAVSVKGFGLWGSEGHGMFNVLAASKGLNCMCPLSVCSCQPGGP